MSLNSEMFAHRQLKDCTSYDDTLSNSLCIHEKYISERFDALVYRLCLYIYTAHYIFAVYFTSGAI